METINDLINTLNNKGLRKTKLRILLLKILLKNKEPLSVEDIVKKIIKNKFKSNKTSIYRQLFVLKNEKIIKEIQLGENKKRYEIFSDSHHHHLVCLDCGDIQDIEAEKDLCFLEKKINQEKKFKVEYHLLEFFGRCLKCNY